MRSEVTSSFEQQSKFTLKTREKRDARCRATWTCLWMRWPFGIDSDFSSCSSLTCVVAEFNGLLICLSGYMNWTIPMQTSRRARTISEISSVRKAVVGGPWKNSSSCNGTKDMLYKEQKVTNNGSIRSISSSFSRELARDMWERRNTCSLERERKRDNSTIRFRILPVVGFVFHWSTHWPQMTQKGGGCTQTQQETKTVHNHWNGYLSVVVNLLWSENGFFSIEDQIMSNDGDVCDILWVVFVDHLS